MGANYNCILFPTLPDDRARAAIGTALRRVDCQVVLEKSVGGSAERVPGDSNRVVFLSPPGKSDWMQLAFSGEGWQGSFPEAYVMNRLAAALSYEVGMVVNLWTYDSGYLAGYGIYEQGNQVEAQTLAWRDDIALKEFTPRLPPPQPPTALGRLLKCPAFSLEEWVSAFPSLQHAMAALAARFGGEAHLLDWCDVQDGDGGLAVHGEEYQLVRLNHWRAMYYEETRGAP